MKLSIDGLKSAIKLHNEPEYSLFVEKENTNFFKTALSPFKWVKLKQNNIPAKHLSSFLSFISNGIYFISIYFVFLSPVRLMGSTARWRDNFDRHYDYSQNINHVADEMTSMVIGNLIGAIIVIPVIALLLSKAASLFRKFSSAVNRKNIDQYRELDNRKPVILLRAFKNKKVKFGKSKHSMLYRGFVQENRIKNLDDLLYNKFWNIGPTFSFANPKGELNLSGTLKQSVDNSNDATWKEKITQLVDEAIAVCMAVEATESLKYELDLIAERNHLSKTLFIFKNKIDSDFLSHFKNLSSEQKTLLSSGKAKALFYKEEHPIILLCKTDDPVTYLYLTHFFFQQLLH